MELDLENNLSILYYEYVNSVMDEAWNLLNKNKFKTWYSVLAKAQTKGRGQMGKVWVSPKGHLYAAIRLPNTNCFNNNCSSVIFGFLVAKSLNKLYKTQKTYLKWPNDLLNSKGNKIGGILTEIKKNTIIAGLGINLKKAPENFVRNEKAPQADALKIDDSPEILWPKLFKNIFLEFETIKDNALCEILKETEDLLLWKNKKVIVENPSTNQTNKDKIINGIITGLCKETGTLVIFDGTKECKIWSGNIYLA